MTKKTCRQTRPLLSNDLYVLTSTNDGRFGASTITWISQTSSKPRLVMAAIRPQMSAFKCLCESRVAAVHIFAPDQRKIAQKFLSATRVIDDTINGEPFLPGVTRAPILKNASVSFECFVRYIARVGDHAIVVMEVLNAASRHPVRRRPAPIVRRDIVVELS